MFKLINNLLMEFFLSDFLQGNIKSIITTFGLSMAGTGVKAVSAVEPSINNNVNAMTLVDIFQIGSYAVSMLVGVTVIIRFILFISEKRKILKLIKEKEQNGI